LNITQYQKNKFGFIPSDWDINKLENIAVIKGRVGWRGYKKEDLRDSGPLVIGAKHITDTNRLDLHEPTYISKEKYEESPEIKLKVGDVLLVQRGSLGKVAFIAGDIGPATINPSMVIIRSKNFNSHYIYYALCSGAFLRQCLNSKINYTTSCHLIEIKN
jgi:type I restriction enzyme S subunit